jgi:hypothetical protein
MNTNGESGLRWQSGTATPLFERMPAGKSGVVLRFPPQSKNCRFSTIRVVFSRG